MHGQEFIVELLAKLDITSVNKDYEQLKKRLTSDPFIQKFTFDTTASKQAIKEMASEIHSALAKSFKDSGIESFDITVKEVQSALSTAVKESNKLSRELDKAASSAQKFLARFNNKTGGSLINSKEFKNVQAAINGLGDTHSLEQLKSSMTTLETTYNNMVANLRAGGKSLNPFINAINDMNNMDKTLKGISLEFEKLSSKPKSVANSIKELSSLQAEVNKYTQGTTEWSQAYGKLKVAINSVNAEISNLSKAKAANISAQIFNISDLEKQGNIYFTKARNTIEKMLPSIKSKFNNLGFSNISVKGIEDATGKIKAFTVTANDAEGTLKKFNFEREKIRGNGKAQYGFIQSDTVQVLKTVAQAQEELATKTEKANIRLSEQQAKLANKKQVSFDNGTAITKISELTAHFQKLGFTEDEISQKMSSVTASYNNLQSAISSGKNSAIISANEKFNRSLAETNNLYKQIKADSSAYYNTTKQTKLSNDIQNWMSKNTAATKQAKTSLQEFLGELNSGRVNVSRLNEIQTKFQQIDTHMRTVGRLGKSFTQVFAEGMKKFSYWTSSTFIIMKTIQEVKQAITNVKNLDTALIDLKKTTSMSASQLEDFYYQSNEVAKQMGVSTKEILDQASAWSRLGYSSNEAATQMAKYSSMFTGISPGMNIDRATDGLVSVMKAFKIETDDVLDGIMSKINIIGNNKALNNSDIVDFLTRSSSAMAEANNSLEETIALGESAIEITRDAASVGQVLKTTSMRIRSYDEETESYTEDLENLKGEIASLTKTANTPGGISLFTDETKETYKSTYKILEEISSIWDELTDKNQANDMCLCA